MSSLNLRRIGQVDVLRRISFEHLVDLLRQVGGPPIAERIDLDADHDDFAFNDLARILADPFDGFPVELADALHHVNELADAPGMEALLDACQHPDVHALHAPTPADVALVVWLVDRDTLVRVHAERLRARIKRYETYRSKRPRPFPVPDAVALAALHMELDDWFERKKKGRHTRVEFTTRGKTTWILIRHGLAMDRRAVIRDNETYASVDRPERIDVISYVATRGELSIHALTLGEREVYRTALGLHLFGSRDHFEHARKFTFQPLIDQGEDALVCDGIDGILDVKLKEVGFRFYGTENMERIERAKADLFAAWGDHIPWKTLQFLHRVSFLVKFNDGSKKPRTVKIELPRVASYGREADEDVVNDWLERQGFILPLEPADG